MAYKFKTIEKIVGVFVVVAGIIVLITIIIFIGEIMRWGMISFNRHITIIRNSRMRPALNNRQS